MVLSVFILWLIWIYHEDNKERSSVSHAIWIVVLWAIVFGSRPVTEWFSTPSQNSNLSSADEGNVSEAIISLSLILAGSFVLLQRRIRCSSVIRDNGWLFVFYLFWLISVLWSDFPVITFKRLFKDFGTVIMVLVVLTEVNKREALKAVCRRLVYLCVPLSIILIRYFPDLGRAYVGYSRNEAMLVGVAMHKNTLGVLAMVGAVFLLWEMLDSNDSKRKAMNRILTLWRVLVLAMCWHILVIANSVTSLICAVLGSILILTFRIPQISKHPGYLETIGISIAAIFVVLDSVDSVVNVKGAVLDIFGRDETLTTRTDIWPILTTLQDRPLIGSGFNSFWTGERLVLSSERLGGIVQAHNGYIETYLNGGIIGVVLLICVLLSAYWHVRKQIALGDSLAVIQFVVLLITIVYNYSEAAFNKVGVVWLLTVLSVMNIRIQRLPHKSII